MSNYDMRKNTNSQNSTESDPKDKQNSIKENVDLTKSSINNNG